jgi:hypothetical protein
MLRRRLPHVRMSKRVAVAFIVAGYSGGGRAGITPDFPYTALSMGWNTRRVIGAKHHRRQVPRQRCTTTTRFSSV